MNTDRWRGRTTLDTSTGQRRRTSQRVTTSRLARRRRAERRRREQPLGGQSPHARATARPHALAFLAHDKLAAGVVICTSIDHPHHSQSPNHHPTNIFRHSYEPLTSQLLAHDRRGANPFAGPPGRRKKPSLISMALFTRIGHGGAECLGRRTVSAATHTRALSVRADTAADELQPSAGQETSGSDRPATIRRRR